MIRPIRNHMIFAGFILCISACSDNTDVVSSSTELFTKNIPSVLPANTVIPTPPIMTENPIDAFTPAFTATPATTFAPCPYSEDQILREYPLAVGAKWIYEVDYLEHNTGVPVFEWQGKIEEEVIKKKIGIDNFIYFTIRYAVPSERDDIVYLRELERDIIVTCGKVFEYKPIYMILEWPLESGRFWDGLPPEQREDQITGAHMWYVEEIENVVVPAGNFYDCLKLSYAHAPGHEYRWFCPGIGYVKIDGWGRHMFETWELVEYIPPILIDPPNNSLNRTPEDGGK